MAENSKIEWTDHTFNPWIGCTKVSGACDHCYAETWDKRFAGERWGPHAARTRTSQANWAKPRRWDRIAAETGRRARVFCASLADVFDNHRSILPEWRADLWRLIAETQHLDWLMLTKRPQNIAKMLPDRWGDGWPNVWLGTTAENQATADARIPHLLATPAAVRFISAEPLLGPVDLLAWLPGCHECAEECGWRSGEAPQIQRCRGCGDETALAPDDCEACGASSFVGVCPDCGGNVVCHYPDTPNINWVICGGESGPGARPMEVAWAESLRDQCRAAGVAFFMKQMAKKAPIPADLMVREFPDAR